MKSSLWRVLALLLAAAVIPACGDSDTTIVTQALTSVDASVPASATGATTDNETIAGSAIGSDDEPRLVFLRAQGGTSDLRFTRRNADGTWTTSLLVSASDADAKTSVQVEHTPNGMTHIIWLEGTAVHYARVNNATVPAINVADTILSATEPSNVTAGATLGAVTALTAASSPAGGNVYILWIQSIDDDAGAGGLADVVPVASVVSGGAGTPGEHFTLVQPDTDANAATSASPFLRTASDGSAHTAWFGTDAAAATNAVRHRLRTGVATWSSGPDGDTASAGLGGGDRIIDLLIAADGDAYAVWVTGGTVDAAYRAVGGGSTFAAPIGVPGWGTGIVDAVASLEPGTEILHVAVSNVITMGSDRRTAGNLGGAWGGLNIITSTAIPGGLKMWSDSTDRTVITYQTATEVSTRVRVTAAASWGGVVWTSPTTGFTQGELAVSQNSLGDSIVAWRDGETSAAPFGEISSMIYTSGGTFGGTRNISVSAGVGSHAVVPYLTDLGSQHYLWQETALTAPDANDIFYSRHQ